MQLDANMALFICCVERWVSTAGSVLESQPDSNQVDAHDSLHGQHWWEDPVAGIWLYLNQKADC